MLQNVKRDALINTLEQDANCAILHLQLGAIIKIGLDNSIITPMPPYDIRPSNLCYIKAMEQNNDLPQKQPADKELIDPMIVEMKKMNFSLSEISSSLAFFKWLTIIVIFLVIIAGIITFAFIAKSPILKI